MDMEEKVGGEKSTVNGNQVSFPDVDKNDIPIKDLTTSESKTPLKTPVKDGAEEIQVKFASNDSAAEVNGDAKIDMDHVKSCFSGMSKEELLQYVNDPFWVRTRLFLFVFFWITWIAMLVGAIAIIVVAPKCEPPKWYNQGPFYDVDIKSFLNAHEGLSSGLFNAFVDKMTYLSELNMRGVILAPIFKTDPGQGFEENVVDFKDIDPKLGTMDEFKNLVKEAKSKDIHILLSLVPNHSSNKHKWFEKSVAKEVPYDNYYIWAPSSGTDTDGTKLPPNNWLSVTGGSAWTWNDDRNEFYFHQFDSSQPDLNFRNPHVMKEFNETLNFWLDTGISGFNMKKVQYLIEDNELQNEQISRGKTDAVHTDYNFYYHSKTYNLPETAGILTKWREIIHRKDESDGIILITGEPPIPSDINETTVSVDISRSDKLSGLPTDFTASDLYARLQKLVQNADIWPAFQLGNSSDREDSFNEEDIDGLNIITLLLKGTPFIQSGEELGLRKRTHFPWGNETDGWETQKDAKESHYNIFKSLIKARDSKTVTYGSSNLTMLNESIIVLTRIKAGNPGYLAAFNVSPQNITADFTSIEFVPKELMVYTTSLNYGDKSLNVKDKVNSTDFIMTPKSAVVFTFVPDIGE